MKILIVGAGMFGATCARELVDKGHDVTVIDARPHIGGNCYTEFDRDSGAHVHIYGPHIFHTDNIKVWNWARRFTTFNSYVNMPKAMVASRLYSFPVNLMTFYQVFGCISPGEAQAILETEREPIANPRNMEEACLARMGHRLYKLFFEGYTLKQWGKHPRDLPASIAARIPLRTDHNSNYYNHRFQGIPTHGYTDMFNNMLEGVPVYLNTPCHGTDDPELQNYDRVIFSGPIDEFFVYELGSLEYRSLRFDTKTLPVADFQGNAVINYPAGDVDYTRIVEHKHFTPEHGPSESTVITYEYPEAWEHGRVRFYPIGTAINNQLAAAYAKLAAERHPNVIFGGRLGSYRYMDMDKTIESALDTVAAMLGDGQ